MILKILITIILGIGLIITSKNFSKSPKGTVFYTYENSKKECIYDIRIDFNDIGYLEKSFNLTKCSKVNQIGLINKELYFDFSSQERIFNVEIQNEIYLVKDKSTFERNWIVEDILLLGKIPVKKATYGNEIVWFTTNFEAKVGPDSYNKFSGLVLKVITNVGEYTMTDLVLDTKVKPKPPKKGKHISFQEYAILVANNLIKE